MRIELGCSENGRSKRLSLYIVRVCAVLTLLHLENYKHFITEEECRRVEEAGAGGLTS